MRSSPRPEPGPHFLCADCENDFDELPWGARSGDRRPLCRVCAERGASDGTAYFVAKERAPFPGTVSPAVAGVHEPVLHDETSGRTRGIWALGLSIFTAMVVMVAVVFFIRGCYIRS